MTPSLLDFTEKPAIQEPIDAILAQIHAQSQEITDVRPPHPELVTSYSETLEHFANLRGQPLWYPYLGSGRGNGAFVELCDGSVKLDFISGIGVHFGHAHLKLLRASLEGAVQDIVMQGNLQQNRESYDLMSLLTQHSGMDHCVLTTSGAMANENALKMIFQKQAPATRVLAFERCFMGRSITFAQITDRPAYREGVPLTQPVDYVPFYDWRDPAGSTQRAVDALRGHLKRYPGKHACFCLELIQGEAGAYPGSKDFFRTLLRVVKEHGILIFVDEVQTFGRTERLFAFQSFGLDAWVDVITVGKLAHTCATLYRKHLQPKPGLISQTYISSTSCLRASIAIIQSLLEEDFLGPDGRILKFRKRFVDHLQGIAERHPQTFEGPFGYGLMIGCTPYKGEREKVIAYTKRLFEAGLIGFIAGGEPTRLRFLPPAGGLTDHAIDRAAQILEETL